MSYKKLQLTVVSLKISGLNLNSHIIPKEEILLSINDTKKGLIEDKNFNEILEKLQDSISSDLKIKTEKGLEISGVNLLSLKKKLALTEKFLNIIYSYLDKGENLSDETLYKIDYILHELTDYFDSDEILTTIQQEFKQVQIINSLTNLLNLQLKITEKINNI